MATTKQAAATATEFPFESLADHFLLTTPGDRLTPSHSRKGRQRHRYYVSARLMKGGETGDTQTSRGWRLPEKDLERSIARIIVAHLTRAAGDHRLLARPEVASIASAATAALAVVARLEVHEAGILGEMVEVGQLGEGTISVTLDASALAIRLGVKPVDLAPDLLKITAPFSTKRRGIETRIVAGRIEPRPDPTLQRLLGKAHHWLAALKAGGALSDIAEVDGHSESYIRTRLPLALLSPTIQAAIIQGTQPPNLSVDAILRADLPCDWQEQERRLGFAV